MYCNKPQPYYSQAMNAFTCVPPTVSKGLHHLINNNLVHVAMQILQKYDLLPQSTQFCEGVGQ